MTKDELKEELRKAGKPVFRQISIKKLQEQYAELLKEREAEGQVA